jgi:hypothetical protein
MTDTFSSLIEADIGTMMNVAGSAVADKITYKGKEIGNRFLTKLGSARAAGRLDLDFIYRDLVDSWKYYRTVQRAPSTVATFVDFVQTVFGLEMPEDSIYRAIYGYDPTKSSKPPQIMAPHKAVLLDKFKVIFSARSTQERLLAASQDIARYAENNEADQTYIVLMLKWIGTNKPELLGRPGMEPLKAHSHGGNLTTENTEKLLKGFASVLIKRQIILQRMADAQPEGSPAANAAGGEDADATPGKEDASTQKVGSTATKISFDPPSTQEEPNWGGLIAPKTRSRILPDSEVMRNMGAIGQQINLNHFAKLSEDDATWENLRNGISHLGFKRINSLSAQLMHIVVRLKADVSSFVTVMGQIQSKQTAVFWPRNNYMAAFQFIRAGGAFDEVTAELNHFCNTNEKAAVIYIALLRYIAKEMAVGNGAPADNEPAPAAAPAAPAAPGNA